MGMVSPVLGLRPGRGGLLRTWKLPKPDSFTSSPRAKASRISSKKVSTMSLASRLLRPTRSNRSSASSAFVSVRSTVMLSLPQAFSCALAGAMLIGQRLQQCCHAGIDGCVVQRGLWILQPEAECEALFFVCGGLVTPDVEQSNISHNG